MTTPRDTPASRRIRANGDGTVYQRKDGRWEAAGYVLTPGDTRKRVRVYGITRKEALAKLTEKIAASNRGVPVVSAQGSLAAYLTYWLENVAVHQLRETRPPTPATPPARIATSSPASAGRSSPSSPPRTCAHGSTSSAPPASAALAGSTRPARSPIATRPARAAASGSLH